MHVYYINIHILCMISNLHFTYILYIFIFMNIIFEILDIFSEQTTQRLNLNCHRNSQRNNQISKTTTYSSQTVNTADSTNYSSAK